MYISHSSESRRQRRHTASHVGQPLDQAAEYETAVELSGEDAKIALDVFLSDRMVGARQLFYPLHPIAISFRNSFHS